MVQIRLCRANHNSEENLIKIIHETWGSQNALYQRANGCMSRNAKAIIGSFLFVQNRSERYVRAKYHCFELLFSQEEYLNVLEIVQLIESFLENDFQFIVRIDALENGCYRAIFVVNSVSYTGKGMFSDRNDTYIRLSNNLKKITNIDVVIAEGTLFDIDKGYARNYLGTSI